MWNRLEGRPRTHHFDKALKAEIRDPLWMLTKQWQMGEFKSDDAGSPVFAKMNITSSNLETFKAGTETPGAYEPNVPLETMAEKKKIPFIRENKEISIDIRLQAGKYWMKLLRANGLTVNEQYIKKYTFSLPPKTRETSYIYAHRDVWQQYAAISGRCIDGYKLIEFLLTSGLKSSNGITATNTEKDLLDGLGEKFVLWFNKQYYQPVETEENVWIPEKLEYRFECSSDADGQNKTLKAEEYYQGQLDWYSLDISQALDSRNIQPENTDSFIPSHVKFDGMPDTRWWKFEDAKTNLGDIKPSTTDLSKLLLMEFGLVFANDWFIVPYTLPIGSIANIEGLTVTNNFGETTWIKPSETAGSDDTIWSMYKLSSAKQNNTLFLAPSAMKVHEGSPLEEIVLIRDEMSNMVWGIETIVPMSTGQGTKGSEIAMRIKQYNEDFVQLTNQTKAKASFYLAHLNNDLPSLNTPLTDAKAKLEQIIAGLEVNNPDVYDLIRQLNIVEKVLSTENELIDYFEDKKISDYKANISYLSMTDVPENWIPFIPVHIDGSNRETQLQRASMLRTIKDDPNPSSPIKIKPQTSILREGLENITAGKPDPLPYYLHEEEVPRSGVRITQSFQRTRWLNGEVFVWLGMKKKTGRGEGSSGLSFDQIVDTKV